LVVESTARRTQGSGKRELICSDLKTSAISGIKLPVLALALSTVI
jgi:hypothetical protein